MNSEINENEPLSKFIFRRDQIKNGKIKTPAFKPPRKDNEVSVMRVLGKSNDKILEMGKKLDNKRKKRDPDSEFSGYGILIVNEVLNLGAEEKLPVQLDVNSDPTDDFPEHANISGYPPYNENDNSLRNQIARRLAARAKPYPL